MIHGRSARRAGRVEHALLCSLLCLGGCVSQLPDSAPFTRATLQLRAAVAESGQAGISELKRLAAIDPLHVTSAKLEPQITSLETAWRARNEALAALVAYAQAIEKLAGSADDGKAAAATVATQLEKLAGSSGIKDALGAAAPLASVATDAAKFIYGQIALARAAASLRAALAKAQPAVERIASLLAADLDDLSAALATCLEGERDEWRERHQVELAFRDSLLRERNTLYALSGSLDDASAQEVVTLRRESAALQVKALLSERDIAQRAALEQRVSAIYHDAAALSPEQTLRLRELGALIADTEEWFRPLQNRLDAIDEREAAQRLLILATKQGLVDWAAAHGALQKALQHDFAQSPALAALVSSTEQIESLVERIRRL